MKKRELLGIVGLIISLEAIIFWWSGQVTELDTIRYSLAARWSARITLFFLFGLAGWVAVSGLPTIYANEESRKAFVLVVSAIAFNHLIHFVFLYINHQVNGYNLLNIRSAGGALGYVLLTSAPFYLWNRAHLQKTDYWKIMGTIVLLLVIAIVSYLGRWNKDLPMPSEKGVYVGIMALAIVLLIMNVYRIFAERKIISKH